jgi:hypothetical protein
MSFTRVPIAVSSAAGQVMICCHQPSVFFFVARKKVDWLI